MKRIAICCIVLASTLASAEESTYQAYVAQIEALQRDGADIARQYGRDALIDRYRTIIDANPGFANNIQLETQIAMLYESDFTDRGEPPNQQAAYETYQHIMETYESDHPYMMTVRRLAAERATELEPDVARGMYESMITDYPDEDALVIQSHYALGKLAEQQGDAASAQNHFDHVLGYTPSGAPMSESEMASVEAYQSNAVANRLAEAIKGYNSPQDRMKALKKYIEKHQELLSVHGDLVQRFAQSIERTGGNEPEDLEAGASMESLLASLKKNDKVSGDSRKDRSRVRELRARDTAERQAELARGDASIDATLSQTAAPIPGDLSRTVPSTGSTSSASGISGLVLGGVTAALLAGAGIVVALFRRGTP